MEMDPIAMKRKAMMPLKIGMVFWIIGLLLLIAGFVMEIFSLPPTDGVDNETSRVLMTLMLGGVGLTLSGLFLSMVSIVRTLGMMPLRLGMVMKAQ